MVASMIYDILQEVMYHESIPITEILAQEQARGIWWQDYQMPKNCDCQRIIQ